MRIAIIGAGQVGRALAKSFEKAGHEVVLASRHTGPPVAEAGLAADLIVLAVPYAAAAQEVCRELGQAASGKVLVDAMNPLNESYTDLTTAGGPAAAQRVQGWLPSARVVKAFNTVFAANLAEPAAGGQRLDGYVAADDRSAAATVLELEAEMGFRPIYVGPLERARELEAMAFLNISLQKEFGGAWRSAWKLAEPPASAVHAAIDRVLAEPERQPRGV
jgi:predicted dinucleotide-binding enzyme